MLKIGYSQNQLSQFKASKQKINSEKALKSSDVLVSNPIKTTSIYDKTPVMYSPISFTGKNIKKNRFEQGREIATTIHDTLKKNIGGVSKPAFQEAFSKINKDNVVPTIKSYNKMYPDNSLMSDILMETGSKLSERKETVTSIFNSLSEIGKEKGVQVEHFKKNFDEELTKETSKPILAVNSLKIDRITNGLVQAIDNKSSLTKEEKLAIKNSKPEKFYDYTSQLLESNVKSAETSFNERVEYDGFFGKLADNVSSLWNSKNRKRLVKEDIEKHKEDIKCLRAMADKGDDEYREVFKNIFNVEYDPELIASYKNKETHLKTSLLAVSTEKFFNDKLSDLVNKEPLVTKYQTITTGHMPFIQVKETKEEMFKRNYEDFSIILGKGDKEKGQKELERKFKDYRLKPNATIDEKYDVMVKMANRKSKQLHQETQAITKGKDINLIKEEFEASYNATFGVENDIAKRVVDYNISQEIGEYAADALIMGPLMIGISFATGSGIGVASVLKGAGVAAGANMVAYSADRLSSKKGMTQEDIEEILQYSILDGSTFIASALASSGINFFTSAAFKGAKTARKVTEITLLTMAETAADAGVAKLIYSDVEIEGVRYSATFSLAGQLLELKLL